MEITSMQVTIRDSPSRNVPDCSQARMVPDVPEAEKDVPSSRSVPKRRSVPMFPVPNWSPLDACSRWENACSQWVKKPQFVILHDSLRA